MTGTIYNSGTFDLFGLLGDVITATVDEGSSVTFNLLGVLDTFNISSSAGSTVTVNDEVSIADTINLKTDGGTISAGSGLLLDDVNAVIDGGDYIVDPAKCGSLSILSYSCHVGWTAAGGTLTLGTADSWKTTSEGAALTGYVTPLGQIDDKSLKFADVTGYTVSGTPTGTQTIVVDDGAGSFTFRTSGAGLADGSYGAGAGPLTVIADATGGTIISPTCFLSGTHLQTPDGERRVETLRAGDLVAVRANGETAFRPVAWIGRRTMDVGKAGPDARPIRIREGAFAPGVPHRDLLVTGDHCVFADGNLIPARMLVNGASIIVDGSVRNYEFFHVELEQHSILISEGLETESYLDTGNRGNFANAATPALRADLAVDPSADAWATRAVAPLAVDRETVEPIWRRLAERAGSHAAAAPAGEPDLRLVTDAGVEIRPSIVDGAQHAFVIPGGTRALRLVSRAARPCDAIGPYVDDRRVLGVLVGKIGLGIGRRRIEMEAASFAGASGWHAPEAGARCRWTDGDAVLPLDLSACRSGPALLSVELLSFGPHVAAEPPALAA